LSFKRSGAFRKRHRHRLSLRRRGKILLLEFLGREEALERVAAAIALGVAIGFSPFIGFHLLIALGLATLLGLNRLDAALGTLAGNPWTLPPVFALGHRLGRAVLHHDPHRVPPLNWHALLHSGMGWVLHPLATARSVFGPRAFVPRLHAFLLGTTVLAILIGAVAYFLALGALQIYHRRHPRVAARAARRRTTATGEPKAQIPRPKVAITGKDRSDGNSSHLIN
jgi:uncharacterized protein (DUF2062 family)